MTSYKMTCKSEAKYFLWKKRANEKGFSPASFNYAEMFGAFAENRIRDGKGIYQSIAEVLILFEKEMPIGSGRYQHVISILTSCWFYGDYLQQYLDEQKNIKKIQLDIDIRW